MENESKSFRKFSELIFFSETLNKKEREKNNDL